MEVYHPQNGFMLQTNVKNQQKSVMFMRCHVCPSSNHIQIIIFREEKKLSNVFKSSHCVIHEKNSLRSVITFKSPKNNQKTIKKSSKNIICFNSSPKIILHSSRSSLCFLPATPRHRRSLGPVAAPEKGRDSFCNGSGCFGTFVSFHIISYHFMMGYQDAISLPCLQVDIVKERH